MDWDLAKAGAYVAFTALLLAVIIGALIGVFNSWFPHAEEWPTPEMAALGDVEGLLTGIALAIPRYVSHYTGLLVRPT
jgi:Domain of unknown function (DUF389)